MDLSLPFDQHAFASLDKQLRLADLVGSLDWSFDMEDGRLRFGDRYAFEAQVLGTHSDATRTWLWAWANGESGIPATLLRAAAKLRAWGAEKGVAEFTAPSVPVARCDGQTLAMIAAGMFQKPGFYRGPYDGGAVFLLIVDPAFPVAPRTDALRAASIIGQALAGRLPLGDHRRAVAGYLRSLGWKASDVAGAIAADDGAGRTLRIRFDDRGRIAEAAAIACGRRG